MVGTALFAVVTGICLFDGTSQWLGAIAILGTAYSAFGWGKNAIPKTEASGRDSPAHR